MIKGDGVDSFQQFEEKIARAIEVLKRVQAEKKALEQELERVKSSAKERARETEAQERELVALRREREEVRTRVEKLLEQVNALVQPEEPA
jgi:chromosome segregation ATPase